MQGQTIKIGNEDSRQSGLTAFLKMYSVCAESEHVCKGIESNSNNQVDLTAPFCAVCGKPAKFGIFCSINCQKDLYGA